MRSAALAVLVGTAACGGLRLHAPRYPDTPIELSDDADREQAIDQLWVLPAGAERDAVRARVAAALARRIGDAVDEDHPDTAQDLLFELCALWRNDPEHVAAGLAGQLPLVRRLHAVFAKAGATEPAIATIVLLAELEPAHRTEHLAELDEVLAYADSQAEAEDGADSERAEPIALLQPTVLALPMPWLVDRYVSLLEQRQHAVEVLRAQQTLPARLVSAHHDVIHTAHRIANALARAGRFTEIHAHLVKLSGVGADPQLAMRAESLADQPTSDAYYDLALSLASDREAPDPAAALAICLRGLEDFPKNEALLAAAAGDAADLGRVDQAIALYEAALQAQHGDVDPAVALRLGKLYGQRISRLALGGRPGAAETAWQALETYTDRADRRAPSDVWRQVAAIGEASLGRGLVSQGQLDDAERALKGSLDRAPSIDAFETLATIYGKTHRLTAARRIAAEGLALLGTDRAGDRYHRAKLERIAGDAEREAGEVRDAATLYLDSLRMWSSLGKDDDLPHGIAAERKLEVARSLYYLDDTDNAVDLALASSEADPDSPTASTQAVAFLLEIGHPGDAADALHRTLGSTEIGELYKVYACLWVVGDARRRGTAPDRFAVEYLASRRGTLWYEQLAQAASGRLTYAALAAMATTGPRKAELAFYGTVLGLDPAARTPAGARARLAEVVHAGLVLETEYDLARMYLSR